MAGYTKRSFKASGVKNFKIPSNPALKKRVFKLLAVLTSDLFALRRTPTQLCNVM